MRCSPRSRSVVGLLAVACLAVAAGCGADSSVQLSDESTDATDASEATWAPAVTDSLEPASVVTSTPVTVSAPFDASADDSDYVPVRWLVPWDGGFLAVGVRVPPQPLPDQLPPEVAALFPPEVTALFPDGRPPTLEEAADTLREAGLLDEVERILNEHPEAMDALQSAPQPDPELVASWSIDGDTWAPTEMLLPDGVEDVSRLTVSGDQLTIAGATSPSEDRGPWIVTVTSTTDLRKWTTASVTIAPPEGLPEEVQTWVTPIAVAADDQHWVMRVMVDAMADPLPGAEASQSSIELWSGVWGADATMIDGDPMSWELLTTSDGFLDLGERVMFSPDGQTWTQTPEPEPNVSFQTAAPLGDGALAVTATPFGNSSIVVLDGTGDTTDEVKFPELGDSFSAWSAVSSPAFTVATWPPPLETTFTVEHDGFEFTQEVGDVVAYRLVELSTGDVVVEESVDLQTTETSGNSPFDHLTMDMNVVTITDPETGATIVEIPQSEIATAYEATQAETRVDPGQPDLWLLATTDAETWLLVDLDEIESSAYGPPQLVATNGTVVLVGTTGMEAGTDVWHRYSMTE